MAALHIILGSPGERALTAFTRERIDPLRITAVLGKASEALAGSRVRPADRISIGGDDAIFLGVGGALVFRAPQTEAARRAALRLLAELFVADGFALVAGLEIAGAEGRPKCDCGGSSAGTTHADWCSTRGEATREAPRWPRPENAGAEVEGRYRLVSELGRGGMGVVYLAEDTQLQRQVAIKFLRAQATPAEVVRFRSEAQLLASLDHPNVVHVFDLGEHQDRPYFVMELLHGPTLADLLRGAGTDGLPVDVALGFGRQLCAALEAVHQQGIIHRDIKPGNVIITAGGTKAVLMDFGLARKEVTARDRSTVSGTPWYLAPEDIGRTPLSGDDARRSDIYALGITLYELLAGRPPFSDASVGKVLKSHVGDSPPPLCDLRPDVPAVFESVIMRAISKDPFQRQASCAELVLELARAREASGWEVAVPPGGDPPLAGALPSSAPACVLIDADLVQDPIELCARLRASAPTARMPIVLLGELGSEERALLVRLGVNQMPPKVARQEPEKPRTADETFVTLARSGDEALLELIAHNEARLLRHPAIITALYLNREAPMSIAMRALELALRNGVQLEGIPSFEEVKEAILRDGVPSSDHDQAFAAALRLGGRPPSEQGLLDEQSAKKQAEAAERLAEELARGEGEEGLDVTRLPMAAKLRLAAIGTAFARSQLVRDASKVVALAVVRSPALTEQEAERYAANPELHWEVIRHLARQGNLTRHYSVKVNLVNNPGCPLAIAIPFLKFLTRRDLKQVARNESLHPALTREAAATIASLRLDEPGEPDGEPR